MQLIVPKAEARKMLQSVPHHTFIGAIDKHWKIDASGKVKAQSVLWLFCWAKSGRGSEPAQQASARVFSSLFRRSFAEIDAVLDYDYALAERYATRDIEEEFALKIGSGA